jgi:hypothetical protein
MVFTPNHLSQQDPQWKNEQPGFDNTMQPSAAPAPAPASQPAPQPPPQPAPPLTVIVSSAANAKIGVNGQWLKVKEPVGATGYVAAWFVQK